MKFLGFKKNPIPYYLRAKATILTSLYEGFPNVLIDSIALGTPVISFNCPNGPKEIIIDGVNGFLIENRSEGVFVTKLKEMLQNKLGREKIIESLKKYSSSVIIEKYEQIIS